jgi:hypothetical protein
MAVTSIPPAKGVEREAFVPAEDLRLGEAIDSPKETMGVPPIPPRASVEPEPDSRDDPTDFELRVR